MFAGQELQDDLLLERDYKLDGYSLADKARSCGLRAAAGGPSGRLLGGWGGRVARRAPVRLLMRLLVV